MKCIHYLTAFLFVSINAVLAKGEEVLNKTDNDETFRCNLYMAPSSIPGAGFGLYTLRDIDNEEKIQPYASAPSIPVCDYGYNGLEGWEFNHVDYFWGGTGLADFECYEVSESVMEMGAIANFHTYLANVHPKVEPYDDTIGDRFNNPGAGSFSYHSGHTFAASRTIHAGEEIFADYGENWLDTREGTFADNVPRYEHFKTAEKVFEKIMAGVETKEFEMSNSIMRTMKSVCSEIDPLVGTILPDTAEQYHQIANEPVKKSAVSDELQGRLAEGTIHKRSLEWIQENGICLELIRPDMSTIPGAGRGAFARGKIKEGSIVAAGPLLNIMDKEKLNVYDNYNEETEKIDYVSEDSEVIGQQLLLNYCFGHSDSPLLLCPQTNMILMNHCSSRKPGKGQCGTKGPNAKIQWGLSWDERTPKWLEMSLEEIAEMTENKRRGLSVEVIATRDIFPGQEVFIDYGEEWEEAWNQHLKEWEPPIDDGTYVPVKTMIENKDLRTVDELEDNPYPENVMNVCYYSSYFEQDAEGDEASEWEEDGSAYKVGPDGMDKEKNVYWCEILEKPSDTNSGYTIKISITDLQTGYLTNYPEESISFRMNRYKSDVHLPGAFRHFISIDDEMFPQQWKVKEEVLEE